MLHVQVDDIQSLLAFLRFEPLADRNIWARSIGREAALSVGDTLSRLRVLMTSICIRRTKALLQDKLPPKVIEIRKVKLDETSQEVYDALFRSAQSILQTAIDAGVGEESILSNWMALLECITRLRQCTDSIDLLPSSRIIAARSMLKQLETRPKEAPLTAAEAKAMFAALIATLGPDADESK